MPLKERISAFDGLDITDDQREILEAIRSFVDSEIIPVAKELEARDEFPVAIVDGKIESYYAQVCLMDQPSVRDPGVTIQQMVAAATAKTGENITISRFVRFKLGEHAEG